MDGGSSPLSSALSDVSTLSPVSSAASLNEEVTAPLASTDAPVPAAAHEDEQPLAGPSTAAKGKRKKQAGSRRPASKGSKRVRTGAPEEAGEPAEATARQVDDGAGKARAGQLDSESAGPSSSRRRSFEAPTVLASIPFAAKGLGADAVPASASSTRRRTSTASSVPAAASAGSEPKSPTSAVPPTKSKKSGHQLANSLAAALPVDEGADKSGTQQPQQQQSAPPKAVRSEPGVEIKDGRETCPMCRDAPTSPAKPPLKQLQEDVVMAEPGEQSTGALGLTLAQEVTPSQPAATGVAPMDPAAEPVDYWLACYRCHRWHHFNCIKQRHPETLPEGLLVLGLEDGEAAEKIDRWYCTMPKCTLGISTLKKERKRTSSRSKPEATYAAPSDSDPDSPILPSFDLPLEPNLPIPTAGSEHNFDRRVSQWPALYAIYESRGFIKDGGYKSCTPETFEKEWADEGPDGWRAGSGILLVDNIRDESRTAEFPFVEGGQGIAFARLGGKLPERTMTVADVARINGPEQEIEVLSVDTQNRSSFVPTTTGDRWNLKHWAKYYAMPHPKRLFNIISYEITGTALGDQLEPPRAVKDISWVDRHWPASSAHDLPRVQRYLLMSPAGTFTDWHVDMAASSVYYHVVRGEKVFYFIRPTAKHLAAYKRWASTEKQTMEWLGHSADEVYKVVVKPGATAFIPAGWIHAVYTPKDSLVYGGNFVHTLAIPMQLRVCEIEVAHQEEEAHRFPHFLTLCWFVAKDYTAHLASLQKLSDKATARAPTTSGRPFEPLTPAVLGTLLELARFLCGWVEGRVLKKLKGSWTAADTKKLRDDIKAKDPFALVSMQLAHEFKGRVVTQLRLLGQAPEEDAASEEAELVKSAQQVAAVRPKVKKVNGASVPSHSNGLHAESSGAVDEHMASTDETSDGFSEAWTEPEIEKSRVFRRRPGAADGSRAEEAFYTVETQSQIQHKTLTAPNGAVTQSIHLATRVKHRTEWPEPALAVLEPIAPPLAAPLPSAVPPAASTPATAPPPVAPAVGRSPIARKPVATAPPGVSNPRSSSGPTRPPPPAQLPPGSSFGSTVSYRQINPAPSSTASPNGVPAVRSATAPSQPYYRPPPPAPLQQQQQQPQGLPSSSRGPPTGSSAMARIPSNSSSSSTGANHRPSSSHAGTMAIDPSLAALSGAPFPPHPQHPQHAQQQSRQPQYYSQPSHHPQPRHSPVYQTQMLPQQQQQRYHPPSGYPPQAYPPQPMQPHFGHQPNGRPPPMQPSYMSQAPTYPPPSSNQSYQQRQGPHPQQPNASYPVGAANGRRPSASPAKPYQSTL